MHPTCKMGCNQNLWYHYYGSLPAKSTIRFGWCFLLVWVLGGRIRKAALSECPVDTCNRRGFSAEKRIRPPPPQDLKLWLQVLFFISDSNHKIAIAQWTMAHARPDGYDTLLLPIHASLIRNSGVSFLYGHSSRKDELTFKSRQKTGLYPLLRFSYLPHSENSGNPS